ncbi:MAG: hypothetical protein WC467_04010 [Patescibacteria group bacterium]
MMFSLLHSFINIFADGYSDMKAFLFLPYLGLLTLLYLIFKNKKIKHLNWRYFGATLLIIYLYGLALQIFYSLINKIQLTMPIITGGNGQFSYSSLWHTQILKGSIGIIFPHLKNVDAGGAYLGVFPNIIFWIAFILLIIALSQALIYFISSFQEVLKGKNTRQIIFLIIGYALLSFSLIKNSIDGGFFQPALLIGAWFIVLFILREKNKGSIFYYINAGIALLLMAINLYFNQRAYGSGYVFIQAAAIVALYNLIFYGSAKKIKFLVLGAFILIFFGAWHLYSYRDLGVYNYGKKLIPADREAYFFNPESGSVESLKSDKAQQISELAKKFNINLNYLPISVPGQTCNDKLPLKRITLTLISKKSISRNLFPQSEFLKIVSLPSVQSGDNWKTNFILYKASCTPDLFSLLNSTFISRGIDTYAFYNFSDRLNLSQ